MSISEKFSLKDKVSVVLGGTSGIGKSICIGLAEAGSIVVPIGRSQKKINNTAKELNHIQGKVLKLKADVLDEKSLKRSLDLILNEYGKVNILINSAGAHKKIETEKMKEKEWDTVVNTNLKGTFLSCKTFGNQMIKQKSGSIINIASLGSYVGLSYAAAYCASKGGVLSFTKALSIEWAKYNIRINAIAPGVFRTPLNDSVLQGERLNKIISSTPMGRLGKTEELVGSAVYLASDAASFVTGETISVDGGFLALGI